MSAQTNTFFLRFVIATLLLGGAALVAWNTGLFDGEIEIAPIERVNPNYPQEAVNKGLEGDVVLRFSVEPDGTTSNIQIVNSVHNGVFDQSAKNALSQWIYTAPNEKVEGLEVALTFSLN